MLAQNGIPMGLPVVQGLATKTPVEQEPTKACIEKYDATGAALLLEMGYAPGLAKEIVSSLRDTPLRFWIVDNSYSMNAVDGKLLYNVKKGPEQGATRVITSTRVEELQDAVMRQVELSAGLGARTDFHHINVPRGGAPKCVTLTSDSDTSGCAVVGTGASSAKDAVELLGRSIIPCGSTPLTAAVNEVHEALAPLATQMRGRGERATVVIATDGRPDHPASFLHALQHLQSRCPVWIIVRLCTNDEDVVGYWTGLDKQLERPLEVLDDVFGEAAEVHACNPWITYAPQLHAARLFGVHNKLFDLLDETAMPPAAIKRFCELLLDCSLPEPEVELDGFLRALAAAQQGLPCVYDTAQRRMRPWVDVDRLGRKLRARKLLHDLGLGALGGCLLGAL